MRLYNNLINEIKGNLSNSKVLSSGKLLNVSDRNSVIFLSDNVFDSSVSKIINVCIENELQKNKDIAFYKKPKGTESIYRSIILRKTFFDKLIEMRDRTGISFSRLINASIRDFLVDYKDEL